MRISYKKHFTIATRIVLFALFMCVLAQKDGIAIPNVVPQWLMLVLLVMYLPSLVDDVKTGCVEVAGYPSVLRHANPVLFWFVLTVYAVVMVAMILILADHLMF